MARVTPVSDNQFSLNFDYLYHLFTHIFQPKCKAMFLFYFQPPCLVIEMDAKNQKYLFPHQDRDYMLAIF